jgi:hypothetical protein
MKENKLNSKLMLVPPVPILDHHGNVCVDIYRRVAQRKILR